MPVTCKIESLRALWLIGQFFFFFLDHYSYELAVEIVKIALPF